MISLYSKGDYFNVHVAMQQEIQVYRLNKKKWCSHA